MYTVTRKEVSTFKNRFDCSLASVRCELYLWTLRNFFPFTFQAPQFDFIPGREMKLHIILLMFIGVSAAAPNILEIGEGSNYTLQLVQYLSPDAAASPSNCAIRSIIPVLACHLLVLRKLIHQGDNDREKRRKMKQVSQSKAADLF